MKGVEKTLAVISRKHGNSTANFSKYYSYQLLLSLYYY